MIKYILWDKKRTLARVKVCARVIFRLFMRFLVRHEGIKYNPLSSIVCYIVRVYAVSQISPYFLRAFRVCVNVCVVHCNTKNPQRIEPSGTLRGGKNDIETAFKCRNDLLFCRSSNNANNRAGYNLRKPSLNRGIYHGRQRG